MKIEMVKPKTTNEKPCNTYDRKKMSRRQCLKEKQLRGARDIVIIIEQCVCICVFVY